MATPILNATTQAQGPQPQGPSIAELQAYLETLKAENSTLRAAAATSHRVSMKISDKGALSVYGVGRFPVTLYRGQWERILAQQDAIKAFLEANASKLATKTPDSPKAPQAPSPSPSQAPSSGEPGEFDHLGGKAPQAPMPEAPLPF